MKKLTKEFPNEISMESIGKSVEDRDIYMLKV